MSWRTLLLYVFPACAGMFQPFGGANLPIVVVFPACAGMFPDPGKRFSHLPGFPRVRGDVPLFSTDGWNRQGVFPACAGMFRFGHKLLHG